MNPCARTKFRPRSANFWRQERQDLHYRHKERPSPGGAAATTIVKPRSQMHCTRRRLSALCDRRGADGRQQIWLLLRQNICSFASNVNIMPNPFLPRLTPAWCIPRMSPSLLASVSNNRRVIILDHAMCHERIQHDFDEIVCKPGRRLSGWRLSSCVLGDHPGDNKLPASFWAPIIQLGLLFPMAGLLRQNRAAAMRSVKIVHRDREGQKQDCHS